MKNGPSPASFSFIFGLFKQTFFTTNQCKKCPVLGFEPTTSWTRVVFHNHLTWAHRLQFPSSFYTAPTDQDLNPRPFTHSNT